MLQRLQRKPGADGGEAREQARPRDDHIEATLAERRGATRASRPLDRVVVGERLHPAGH